MESVGIPARNFKLGVLLRGCLQARQKPTLGLVFPLALVSSQVRFVTIELHEFKPEATLNRINSKK
jgi:hypothetical protein